MASGSLESAAGIGNEAGAHVQEWTRECDGVLGLVLWRPGHACCHPLQR
jgi:hypothetical protein